MAAHLWAETNPLRLRVLNLMYLWGASSDPRLIPTAHLNVATKCFQMSLFAQFSVRVRCMCEPIHFACLNRGLGNKSSKIALFLIAIFTHKFGSLILDKIDVFQCKFWVYMVFWLTFFIFGIFETWKLLFEAQNNSALHRNTARLHAKYVQFGQWEGVFRFWKYQNSNHLSMILISRRGKVYMAE